MPKICNTPNPHAITRRQLYRRNKFPYLSEPHRIWCPLHGTPQPGSLPLGTGPRTSLDHPPPSPGSGGAYPGVLTRPIQAQKCQISIDHKKDGQNMWIHFIIPWSIKKSSNSDLRKLAKKKQVESKHEIKAREIRVPEAFIFWALDDTTLYHFSIVIEFTVSLGRIHCSPWFCGHRWQ